MFSTRRKIIVAFAAAVFVALAGCQRVVPPPTVSPVNDPRLTVDEATQLRNYDQSVSYYATGASVAGGTAYLWQTHETIPDGYRRYTDVPIALGNFLSMPVGVFVESPWDKQVYRGESVPPTYTANPPLP